MGSRLIVIVILLIALTVISLIAKFVYDIPILKYVGFALLILLGYRLRMLAYNSKYKQ